jgi:N-acetylglucosaminyldiphosphoundecaprenol N-acetyl-beta-D-mannosaminyltransferase
MRARWDDALQQAYQGADLVTADGTGLVWAARLLGASLPERVAGIDLMEAFCQRAATKGYRLFLLGARPAVARETAQRLKRRFPALQIVGAHHGYFAQSKEATVLEMIRQARPDLLLVGLGVPRQERWMMRVKDCLNVPVMIGVGGSFDVLSGRLPRAPRTWQRAGLEWLWRALREPRRFWRLRVIPLFLLKILWYKAVQLLAY